MRKLNVRFFLILVGSVIALAGALFGVYRLQQDRIGRALLWQAEHARNEGRTEKAVQFYSRYLEFQPNDSSTKIALGEILEQQLEKKPLGQRNPSQVIYLYEEVLQADGAQDDLRRRVVNMYMLPRLRRYGDALSHLDVLLRNRPDDGALWQQKALCQEGLAQYEAAAESYAKAAQFPPDQVHSYELRARLLRKHLNRLKQADETVQRMVEQHGGSFEAYLARARYRIEFNLGDVAEDADKAYKLAPDNAESILLAARVEQQRNHVPQAIELLEKGNRLYPNDPRMYRHLAWIHYFQKKNDLARQWLQDGIVACPDAFDLHTALAELLIQGKMFDQVQKIVSDLNAKGVREERIQYLTARIAVEREQWPEAVTLLERLRTESRGNPELSVQLNLLLALCQKQLGESDRQLEALKRVLEHDAQNIGAHQAIGAAYAGAGRYDEAVKEYQQLVNLPGAPETAATDLVRLMISRKLRLPPERRQWQDAEHLLDQVAQRQPASVELLLAKGELLAAQKKTREAADLLSQARAGCNDARLWLQAAQYAEQADGNGAAALDEAEKALGDSVELRLKRGALLLGRSHAELVRALPALERPAPSFTPEQLQQLRIGLAEMSFLVHDFGNARRLYRQLAADRPGDVSSRMMLVEIALHEKDMDSVPKLLAEVRQIEPPGGTMVPLLEARYQIVLAEDGDRAAAEKARGILQDLLQKRSNWAPVYQSLARLAEVDEDRAKAIEHYRRAIELGDGDLRSHYRLVRLLVEAHQEKAAEQVLRSVQERGSLSPERQRQMLQSVLPLVSNSTMQNIITQTVSKDSTDPQDHVWLGKMFWDTGDRIRALDEFRKATAQAGKVPQNWVTLVQALTANGQIEEAQKAVEEARRQLPADSAAATLAVCQEITRQFDESASEYAKAFQARPSDPQLLRGYARLLLSLGKTRQAMDLFQRVIDNSTGLTREDVAWARRNLAIVSTVEGKPEQFRRSLELLKQNASEFGESIEDLRAKVVLLANMPPKGDGTSPRQQAIGILETVIRHPQATVADRFSLAKLYDAEHDWAKAEEQYRAALTADPKNVAAWTYFVRRLLQLAKFDAAAEPLRQLEKLAPQAASTISLRSRWLFQRGETEKLLAQLQDYVSQAEAKSAEAYDRAFLAGALLDEFARSTVRPAGQPNASVRLQTAALQMYQQAVAHRRVDATVRAAALLSHFGSLNKTLAWLDQPQIAQDPNLKASATLAALRAGHADEQRCRETEKWLRELARQHASVDLDLQLADLLEMEHKFDEAENLYRKVVRSNPNHVVALNNLAWVIAHRQPSDEALELVQKAIAIAGPLIDLLDTRAKVYLSLGRAAEAIQDLEDAVNELPTAVRYFQLALAQEMNANRPAAKSAFTQAIRHGIDVRDLHPQDAKEFERLQTQLEITPGVARDH
jgi:tetratricopeptide (TPR) repeat protein